MAKQNKKKRTFSKILTTILLIVNILFITLTLLLNVIPFRFIMVILITIFIVNAIIIWLLFSKKGYKRLIGSILATIMIVIPVIGAIYEFNTLDFLSVFGGVDYKTLNYNVIVLKNSDYENIKDLNKKTIGFIKDQNVNDAINTLDNKIDFKTNKYSNIADTIDSLLKDNSKAIVLEDANYTILAEENPKFVDKVKVIHTFAIDIKVKNINKKVNVTKDAFNIYISGIDSYGKITSVSRSDVNMVVTVNPNTNEIVLTSIPRDYYVRLHNTTGYKDKLTHAGIYGIDTSVATIEDLLEIDINYYLKVNFTSLIKIVDELDGINVYSKYAFTSRDGYTYQAGYNDLNGKEALSFVRERKAFKEGDRVRGENQQAVLEAIIKKALSPKIITKYNSLLNSVEGSFITNIDDSDITKLIKKQLNDNNSWSFKTLNLNGTDGYEYTYSYSANKLYVMIPDEESLTNVKETLKETLN